MRRFSLDIKVSVKSEKNMEDLKRVLDKVLDNHLGKKDWGITGYSISRISEPIKEASI